MASRRTGVTRAGASPGRSHRRRSSTACRPRARSSTAAMAETKAIHNEFGKKRGRLLNGLRDLGFTVDLPPEGTFYVWASAQHLPSSISDGMSFFRAALEKNVITVPGEFFDVDPGKRRGGRASRFRRHLRFSFGPAMAKLDLALARFKEVIANAQ